MRTIALYSFLFLASIIAALGCGSDETAASSSPSSGGDGGGGGGSSSSSSSGSGGGMTIPTCVVCQCTCGAMKEIRQLKDPVATCDTLVGMPCGAGGGGAGGGSPTYSDCDQIGITEGCL